MRTNTAVWPPGWRWRTGVPGPSDVAQWSPVELERPVFEQVEQRELAPVAVVSDAQADLLVMTLRVHGIDATAPSVSAFPSLDWAEGRAISVQVEQVAEAVALLRGFGHETLPPGTT
jgi:hypothetical protein